MSSLGKVVRPVGFEPTAFCSGGKRSIQAELRAPLQQQHASSRFRILPDAYGALPRTPHSNLRGPPVERSFYVLFFRDAVPLVFLLVVDAGAPSFKSSSIFPRSHASFWTSSAPSAGV